MTDKELQKLRRTELLEILISLSEENEALKKQVEQQKKQLDDRTIQLQEAGSIADASLKVSGVFKAAQEAANRYLENVQFLSENAQREADGLLEKTKKECARLEEETRLNVEKKKNSLQEWLDRYCEVHQEVKGQIQALLKEDLLPNETNQCEKHG